MKSARPTCDPAQTDTTIETPTPRTIIRRSSFRVSDREIPEFSCGKSRSLLRERAQQQQYLSSGGVERQRVTGSGNRVVGPRCKREQGPASAATAIMANNSLSDCQALRRPTQNCRTPRVHCAYGVLQKYGFDPIINRDRLNALQRNPRGCEFCHRARWRGSGRESDHVKRQPR